MGSDKFVDQTRSDRSLDIAITDELERLVRIEPFIRSVARAAQRALLQSRLRFGTLDCFRSAPDRLMNRLGAIRRFGDCCIGNLHRVSLP